MYIGKLEDHLTDKWVKKLIRAYDPGPLASLIEERIKWPNHTGPTIPYNSDEKSIDIISALMASTSDARKKMEPAIGLILWKMMNNQLNETNEMLFGVFHLVRDNKLVNCLILLKEWIHKNKKYLQSNLKQETDIYYFALFTLGSVQDKSSEMEAYWLDLWKNAKPAFWSAAFSGLRKQSPILAINELPLLVERATDKIGAHLFAMMEDNSCWPLLKNQIQSGLDKENEYCAIALNALIEKLSKEDQKKLIGSLRNGYNPPN